MDEIENAINLIHGSQTIHDLLHEIKPKVLGKQSILAKLSEEISTTKDINRKKEIGVMLKEIRNRIETEFQNKLNILEELEFEKTLTKDVNDTTIPVYPKQGYLHPITQGIHEIKTILEYLGFSYKEGFEIETDENNFQKLNIPTNHPARSMHDTFYLKKTGYLLRTHTTSVDIREIQKHGVPIGIMSCGKVFRNDSDATHSPMFHQFEGLMIDTDMNIRHLKYCLEFLLKKFFQLNKDPIIRLRPSFFPFTEPSYEVDVGYTIQNGRIEIGGSEKFLEILGCGILHPNVLKSVNVNHEKYTGIAFGGGIERMMMLKYGIKDLRYFANSKHGWIQSLKF